MSKEHKVGNRVSPVLKCLTGAGAWCLGECLPGAHPARYFSINYPNFNSTGELGPKRGRKCYVTPAFSGVPNKGDNIRSQNLR